MSAVAKIADQLRNDAISMQDGELLGSEDALVSRFGVSRATLRQAASLIAQEQLLSVRRGVGGGYFAKRPDARGVGKTAALYLKAHGSSLQEIVAAFMPVRVELSRLAAVNREADKHKLREFLAAEQEIDRDPHFRDFIHGERKFNAMLGEMSGNKALALFLETLLDLAALVDREEDMYRGRPDRVAALRAERNRLAQAILDRDEALAILSARRCAQMSSSWLLEDMQARGGSDADARQLSLSRTLTNAG